MRQQEDRSVWQFEIRRGGTRGDTLSQGVSRIAEVIAIVEARQPSRLQPVRRDARIVSGMRSMLRNAMNSEYVKACARGAKRRWRIVPT